MRLLLPLAALVAAAPALAAPPVEVTRFSTPETVGRLGPAWVTVAPAPGVDGNSLETRVWLDAVGRALARHGFGVGESGATRVAEVRLSRDTVERRGVERGPRSSVSFGFGSGGGWHRGGGTSVGVGLGFGFGGGGYRSAEQVESELSVTIRDASTGASLWEGRAVARARAGSKQADLRATAERLAEALFTGFPGRSGETIEVR